MTARIIKEALEKASRTMEVQAAEIERLRAEAETAKDGLRFMTENANKAWARVRELEMFYKDARAVVDGFQTDKPVIEALRALRRAYETVCADAKRLRLGIAALNDSDGRESR